MSAWEKIFLWVGSILSFAFVTWFWFIGLLHVSNLIINGTDSPLGKFPLFTPLLQVILGFLGILGIVSLLKASVGRNTLLFPRYATLACLLCGVIALLIITFGRPLSFRAEDVLLVWIPLACTTCLCIIFREKLFINK